jgi:hypothetical protein
MKSQSVHEINGVAALELTSAQGYPEEWFPSVSATIGDRYPERSVFMLFIALTSGTPSDAQHGHLSD